MGEMLVGPLARSILDRHREAGRALIVRVLDRVERGSAGRADGPWPLLAEGMLVDEHQLARQVLSDEGWVTLGVVTRGEATVFLDVNVRTSDARLVIAPDDWRAEQPWDAMLVPAAVFDSLASVGRAPAEDADRPAIRPLPAQSAPRPRSALRPPRNQRLQEALAVSAELRHRSRQLLEESAGVMALANRPEVRRPGSYAPFMAGQAAGNALSPIP